MITYVIPVCIQLRVCVSSDIKFRCHRWISVPLILRMNGNVQDFCYFFMTVCLLTYSSVGASATYQLFFMQIDINHLVFSRHKKLLSCSLEMLGFSVLHCINHCFLFPGLNNSICYYINSLLCYYLSICNFSYSNIISNLFLHHIN